MMPTARCMLLLPLAAVAVAGQPMRSPGSPIAGEPIAQSSRIERNSGPLGLALITPDIDPVHVDAFRGRYGADADSPPRILIHVNRPLLESPSDASVSSTSAGDTKTEQPEPSLADRQTVREIEYLLGRVLRQFGAVLVDFDLARAALLASSAPRAGPAAPGDRVEDSLASIDVERQRASYASVADLALEVLISTRTMTLTEVSGDREVTVPDLQLTALRLRDSAIVGQANAADLLAKVPSGMISSGAADVRSITEATAFVLMEDLLDLSEPLTRTPE
jgi:hypothetical protein